MKASLPRRCLPAFLHAALLATGPVVTAAVLPSVSIESLDVSVSNGCPAVTWRTSDEYRMASYVLERQSGGQWVPVLSSPLASLSGDWERNRYEVRDPGGRPGEVYRLKAYPERGEARVAGMVTAPVWRVSMRLQQSVAPVAVADYAAPAVTTVSGGVTAAAAAADGVRAVTSLPAPQVHVGIRVDGPYELTAARIASAFGIDAAAAEAAIRSTNLCLRLPDGSPVAWHGLPGGAGIRFHGQAGTSIYSYENPCRLTLEPGLAMAWTNHGGDTVVWDGAAGRFFMSTARFEQGNICSIGFETLTQDEQHRFDYMLTHWVNGALLERDLATGISDWAGPVTAASLRVSYRSFDPEDGTDQHAIRFLLGTSTRGWTTVSEEPPLAWGGKQRWERVLTVPTNVTLDAATVFKVRNVFYSTLGSRIGIDWYDITYPRRYQARGDQLLATAGTNASIIVAGLSASGAVALDLSDPLRPVLRTGLPTVLLSGGWSAGFRPPAPDAPHRVVGPAGWLAPPNVRPVAAPRLADATNAADWVAITPPPSIADLGWAAEQLAAFRRQQGLRTMVVCADEIYDSFSSGFPDPRGLLGFVRATAGWRVRPRYLLLFGNGSANFRAESSLPNLPQRGCPLPFLAIPIDFGPAEREMAAADMLLADDNGDGVPELNVGRLPVTTSNDCVVILEKIRLYESAMLYKSNSVVTADDPFYNTGGRNLHTSADHAMGWLTSALTPRRLYVNGPSLYKANNSTDVANTLKSGASFFYFLGHGAPATMANSSYILALSRFTTTQRWPFAPIAVSMACNNNRFQQPAVSSTSLGMQGLTTSGSGFTALFASSSFMDVDDAITMGEMFCRVMAETPRRLRLGDVVTETVRRCRATALSRPDTLAAVLLMGDPATVIRHDVTSHGTSTSWLAGYGLAAANADVGDQDGDGRPTWQEYRAGTDPLEPDPGTVLILR